MHRFQNFAQQMAELRNGLVSAQSLFCLCINDISSFNVGGWGLYSDNFLRALTFADKNEDEIILNEYLQGIEKWRFEMAPHKFH